MRKLLLVAAVLLNVAIVFAGSPQLVWHNNYGDSAYHQNVVVTAVDNYDNFFIGGYVNFGSYGNVIINRYDGVGNLKWNRLYNNTAGTGKVDMPVALFVNNQAGVTMVAYINGPATVTHIVAYDASGNLAGDVTVGNTTAGNITAPVAVLQDPTAGYYMFGQLNSASSVFKCDNAGNIVWSTALHNNYNEQVGSISFDPYSNIVVGSYDSAGTQVVIHRYDRNTGAEMPVVNTHIDTLPVNDNNVRVLVDAQSNFFVASTGLDGAGRSQWVVNKIDTTGQLLWHSMCNSAKGYSNKINSFLLGHAGDIIVSGPMTDVADAWQYAGVYKISNTTGQVVWSTIDSLFLINAAVTRVDIFDYVYLGVTKTPSAISPYYSEFSVSILSADSGIVESNRSFDNSLDNVGLQMQINNFGDVFLATTNPTINGSIWFAARVGNAAGDSAGTAVHNITADAGNFEVFPNPYSAATHAVFVADKQQDIMLEVFDLEGRRVYSQQLQAFAGKNDFMISGQNAPGVYLLKLTGSDGASTKLIVQQ